MAAAAAVVKLSRDGGSLKSYNLFQHQIDPNLCLQTRARELISLNFKSNYVIYEHHGTAWWNEPNGFGAASIACAITITS